MSKFKNPFASQEDKCVHARYDFEGHQLYCVYLQGDCLLGLCKKCQSYQTKAQRREEELKWAERMRSLPEDKQEEIALKYYRGQKPWKTAKYF